MKERSILNKDNVTCIQKVKFIFNFFEKREWLSGEQPPLKNVLNTDKITSDSIRNLGNFLYNRTSRIAGMMDILQFSHNDWRITGNKEEIIMETETFDFNDAISVLSSNGFNDDEYVLRVEYERKWGML